MRGERRKTKRRGSSEMEIDVGKILDEQNEQLKKLKADLIKRAKEIAESIEEAQKTPKRKPRKKKTE